MTTNPECSLVKNLWDFAKMSFLDNVITGHGFSSMTPKQRGKAPCGTSSPQEGTHEPIQSESHAQCFLKPMVSSTTSLYQPCRPSTLSFT